MPRQNHADFMRLLQGMHDAPDYVAGPLPPPEPGLMEKFLGIAPTLVRGGGMLLGMSPARGFGASGAAEAIAQGIELGTGAREEFSVPEVGLAAVTGGIGGGMAGAAAKGIGAGKPLEAAARALPWAVAQPFAQHTLEDGSLPSAGEVVTSVGLGSGSAYGLGKLAQKLGVGGFKSPKADKPVNEFIIETTAQPGGQVLNPGKAGPGAKVASVTGPAPIRHSGEAMPGANIATTFDDTGQGIIPYEPDNIPVSAYTSVEPPNVRGQRVIDREAREARQAVRDADYASNQQARMDEAVRKGRVEAAKAETEGWSMRSKEEIEAAKAQQSWIDQQEAEAAPLSA